MHAFMRKFSIFIAENFVILSPVPQVLEGQLLPGAGRVGFPKRGIPVSPDSESLKAAQFSRIYPRTKNHTVQMFVCDMRPLYWKLKLGALFTGSSLTVLHYQN